MASTTLMRCSYCVAHAENSVHFDTTNQLTFAGSSRYRSWHAVSLCYNHDLCEGYSYASPKPNLYPSMITRLSASYTLVRLAQATYISGHVRKVYVSGENHPYLYDTSPPTQVGTNNVGTCTMIMRMKVDAHSQFESSKLC